jgi:two-component system sensor histidine kinase UhpB
MASLAVRVLLVEDNPTDVLLLREALAVVPLAHYALTHTERFCEALQCLREACFDVILLDLGLPDSQGLQTFHQMYAATAGAFGWKPQWTRA